MKTINVVESSKELIDMLSDKEIQKNILPKKLYTSVSSFNNPYVNLKGDESFTLANHVSFEAVIAAMAEKLGIEIEFSKI